MFDSPVLTTTCGDVRGVWRAGCAAFLGVPFAEPPVGELRFAAPVPRAGWTGVRDCRVYGPTPQRRPFAAEPSVEEPCIPGEDTLLLNVFTPRPGDTGARLPVFVWIHGGGYTAGSPSSPWYDGDTFARDGVVTVNVSYRLGLDGFSPIEGAPDNRGVLDWICALEWVQANIAAFGGDPRRVTIGGQSAGGGAVLTLLAVPRAQHLFHRAICESGAPTGLDPAAARATTQQVAALCGVEPTREGFSGLSEEAILDAQEALARAEEQGDPVDGLIARARAGAEPRFGPVADGRLMPAGLVEALRSGVGADKDLLIGTTAHEFTMAALGVKAALGGADPQEVLRERLGFDADPAAWYAAAHPGADAADLLGRLLTDTTFRIPLTRWAAAREGASVGPRPTADGAGRPAARSSGSAGTWVYDFRWPSPLTGQAGHCLEMPFVWDHLDAPRVQELNTGPHPPVDLARAVHGAWVGFVADGDPGWPVHRSPEFAGRVFDEPSRTVEGVYGAERELDARWDREAR